MKGFNFEKNLAHQQGAVESTLAVFDGLQVQRAEGTDLNYANPMYNRVEKAGNTLYHNISPFGKYAANIRERQAENGIEEKPQLKSNLIDIMMETGTGKTYTYTKTMFELNKNHGIFKFVVVVPTLSVKAGTIDFLKSASSRAHFKEQYGKTLHLHVVESKKGGKNKKMRMPAAVMSFVTAGNYQKDKIQVMVINAGMINSETMQKSFDRELFDKYNVPFDALAALRPVMIIDEPHRFGTKNKTWTNLEKIRPQFILRYGATFPEREIKVKNVLTGKTEKQAVKDYHNLIYKLTAVAAFNRNLVKGITGHITQFEAGKEALVRFVSSTGTEAGFALTENGKSATVKVGKREGMEKVHPAMTDLYIEKINKSTVVLSNGLEMKKKDSINPYSYAETLQNIMLQKAVKQHFITERELLRRAVKIKPLTLFFIDNIDEYRNDDGYLRRALEQTVKAEAEALLKTETNAFYRAYLEKTLADLSLTHAGYFSKDNSEKDEAIVKEINEILHDKQAMLDLENPRRFIFSKWTLREGWDNPNVFHICKLRSSGSDISKLQEVGRGLRLPVNEYGNRVKDEQFYLHYFVDFTESGFVDDLVREINEKSGAVSLEKEREELDAGLIKIILEKYSDRFENKKVLLKFLDREEVIDRDNTFEEGGWAYIKRTFPLIFEGVAGNKVRKATDRKKKVTVRTEKYRELKALWEKLNEKVILEYKFKEETEFEALFTEFLREKSGRFDTDDIKYTTQRIDVTDGSARIAEDADSIYNTRRTRLSMMKYSDFLKALAKILHINLKTLHASFAAAEIDLNKYLNQSTLRVIKREFDRWLMSRAFDKFSISYRKVSNEIHPTKLTDAAGKPLTEVSASDIGVLHGEGDTQPDYYFRELYYDSDLERVNMETKIEEVIVFTKIPKNSIKIPVAGGKSYSPDFAYVIKYKNGEQKLNLIVETKNADGSEDLRNEENLKIKHAEEFFGKDVSIKFKTQFGNDKMLNLIKEIVPEL